MKKRDKICFYIYSPRKDIGHIMTIIKILKFLKKKNKKLFLIYNTSFPIFKNELKKITQSTLFIKGLKNRNRIIRFVKSHRINIFITEFYPFGRIKASAEIDDVLSKFKNKIKIISLLPMPYFIHSSSKINKLYKILELYDKILIASSPIELKYFAKSIEIEKRITTTEYLDLFKSIKDKTKFIGYIIDIKSNQKPAKKFDIVVTIGGGSTSHKIIYSTLRAIKTLKNKYSTLIICGKNFPTEKFKKLKKIKSSLNLKNVTLRKHTKNFLRIISNCKLVISTAGSTAYEILYFSKKAILIPYKGTKGREHSDQIARSLLLKEFINSEIIDEKKLNFKNLSSIIEKKIKEKDIFLKSNKLFFNGLENLLSNL